MRPVDERSDLSYESASVPVRSTVDRPRRRPRRGALGTTFATVLDWLAPHPCLGCHRLVESDGSGGGGAGLCRRCHGRLRTVGGLGCTLCGALDRPRLDQKRHSRRDVCASCRAAPRPPWRHLTSAWSYAPPLDRVVTALKFRRLEALGERLGRAAVEALPRPAPFERDPAPDLVTWVPLHWRRRWTRGFDQAEEVAHGVAAALDLPCVRLLRRRRATRPQSLAPRAARLESMRGAFRAAGRGRRSSLRSPGVLLVDDVLTTGATLRAAAHALREVGVSRVDVFTVARSL